MPVITVLYYVMTAYLALICLRNFLKERDLQNAAMYAIVMPHDPQLFRTSEQMRMEVYTCRGMH